MQAALTLLLCLCSAALTLCQRHQIKKLPRLNFQPNFKQYSGYLTSTDGRKLFYWLVESSDVAPATAPLVLWLNGGPGCSSLGGLLMTNGPFLANDRAELDRNELAWNRLANMLYIDSPNGVGLSESGPISQSVLNDEFTTELNLRALLDFFSLFPEYRGRPFYITGESYAGIYIPLLAHAILKSKEHFPSVINLTGIAVGNGLYVSANDPSFNESALEFLEVLGLKFGELSVDGLAYANAKPSINPYNVAKPCHKADKFNDNDTYPCLNSTGLTTYLNDESVRRALGANESISGKYYICRLDIFEAYRKTNVSVLAELIALANGNIAVLLYHGTLDYAIPAKVTQSLLKRLEKDEMQNRGNSRDGTWYYCLKESGRASLQIGGLQKPYMQGMISYRTVIGAGHTVPTDRPDMGFQIFADFLLPDRNSSRPDCSAVASASSRLVRTAAACVAGAALLPLLTALLLHF